MSLEGDVSSNVKHDSSGERYFTTKYFLIKSFTHTCVFSFYSFCLVLFILLHNLHCFISQHYSRVNESKYETASVPVTVCLTNTNNSHSSDQKQSSNVSKHGRQESFITCSVLCVWCTLTNANFGRQGPFICPFAN